MNHIHQEPSQAVNLSGLVAATDAAGALTLSGSIAILGATYPVTATFDPATAPTVYASAEGAVSGDNEGAFAHLAWHDGVEWNVLAHPAPEPEPEPVGEAPQEEEPAAPEPEPLADEPAL
jgi:hypothetical protein